MPLWRIVPREKPHFDAAFQGASLFGPGVGEGAEFGLMVAGALLQDRSGDPRDGADGHRPSHARTRHRADPANPTQPFHAPFYGSRSKCFAVQSPRTFFHLDSPSTLSAAEHDSALKQVRGKGIAPELMGTLPTTYAETHGR